MHHGAIPTSATASTIHPQTIEEYEEILMDLPNQELAIDINEVYEYYYMAFINSTNDWLFKDYKVFIKEIGGYSRQCTPISYEFFMRDFSQQRHEHIIHDLERFVLSKSYRFESQNRDGL